jgi:hypothetical protein
LSWFGGMRDIAAGDATDSPTQEMLDHDEHYR